MRLNSALRFRFNDIRFGPKTTFVPNHEPVKETDIKKLELFLQAKPNVLVLTGAGISTESGIPGNDDMIIVRHQRVLGVVVAHCLVFRKIF